MTIERLPERKKWRMRFRQASYCAPSAETDIVTFNNVKQTKLAGLILESPRAAVFNIIVREQDGTLPVIRKRYRLAAAGEIVDARTFEDPILWYPADRTLAVQTAPHVSAGAGSCMSASLDLWELTG